MKYLYYLKDVETGSYFKANKTLFLLDTFENATTFKEQSELDKYTKIISENNWIVEKYLLVLDDTFNVDVSC